MRSPLQAMIWELSRTSRISVAARFAGQFFLVGLLVAFAWSSDLNEPMRQALRGIMLTMLIVSNVIPHAWFMDRIGFPIRLSFARPVSTARLVLTPMLFTALTAGLGYLIPATVFGLLMGGSLPLIGPTAIVMAGSVCLLGAYWTPTTPVTRGCGLGLAVVGIFAVFQFYNRSTADPDPLLLALGKPAYFAMGWKWYAGLATASCVAVVLAVRGVGRQRCGEPWIKLGRPKGAPWKQRASRRWASANPFSGALAAQCWYELRTSGPAVLLFALILPALLLVFHGFAAWVDPGWSGSPYVWLGGLALCPFAYQLVAVDGAIGLRKRSGVTRLSAFDAARPLATDRLITVKLLVIAALCWSGWLLMATVAALHATFTFQWPAWVAMITDLSEPAGQLGIQGWLIAVANVAMFYVGSVAMLFALGMWMPMYPRRFLALFAIAYGHGLLAAWDSHNGWPLHYLWITYAYLLGGVIVAACGWVAWRALVAGLLGKPLILGSFALWTAYAASSVVLYFRFAEGPSPVFALPLPGLILAAASLLIPLAAVIAAPLALASHRHS